MLASSYCVDSTWANVMITRDKVGPQWVPILISMFPKNVLTFFYVLLFTYVQNTAGNNKSVLYIISISQYIFTRHSINVWILHHTKWYLTWLNIKVFYFLLFKVFLAIVKVVSHCCSGERFGPFVSCIVLYCRGEKFEDSAMSSMNPEVFINFEYLSRMW